MHINVVRKNININFINGAIGRE